METSVNPGRMRRTPPWLFETLLIVISVGLGFGAAQYGERRDDRQLAARLIESLRTEVEQNLALLEPVVPIHLRWMEELAVTDIASHQSALDVWFATRPELPPGVKTPFPVLRRSAWDAALASGAVRLIDYEVTTALSAIYRMQELATENVTRLANGALSSHATYDPASSAAAARLLWLTLADIYTAEVELFELYRTHLPRISEARRTGSRRSEPQP